MFFLALLSRCPPYLTTQHIPATPFLVWAGWSLKKDWHISLGLELWLWVRFLLVVICLIVVAVHVR